MAEAFLPADIILSTLQNVSEGLVVYPKVRTNFLQNRIVIVFMNGRHLHRHVNDIQKQSLALK